MTQAKTRILIPTSDRKRAGGNRTLRFAEAQDEREWNRYPSLGPARTEAVRVFLSAINGQGFAEDVLRLKGARLDEATATNLRFGQSALMPVAERECGPLFRALDVGSLDERAARRMREELMVICPLLGLLAPTDLVPEYRCPVGAQIPGWSYGSMHAFWKEHLGPVLNRLCRRRRVFSFLPGRMRALWTPSAGVEEVVTIQFATRRPNGDLRIENAGAGKLAGSMIRAILQDGLDEPTRLQGWKSAAGHEYMAVHSDRGPGRWNMMFVR